MRIFEISKELEQLRKQRAVRYQSLKTGIETLAKSGLLNKIHHPNPKIGDVYMIVNGQRPTVLVNYNGLQIPFYMSTGLGGKADFVPVDKWYPFFGIGPSGWVNKSGRRMASYYGSPVLKSIAERLDAALHVTRDVVAPDLKPNTNDEPSILQQINKGLSPDDGGTQHTVDNINSFLQKIESIKSSANTEIPKSNSSSNPITGPLSFTINGVNIGPLNISTNFGRASMKKFGDDYKFWSDVQFKLEKNTRDNTWTLIPNGAAINKTLINGSAINAPIKISKGMRIAVGNPEKQIEKLPMVVT